MAVIKNCLMCGKEFKVLPYLIRQGFGKYCSSKCFGIASKGIKKPRKVTRKIIIKDEYALVPLTKELFAKIDLIDIPKVDKYNWYAQKACNNFYAGTRIDGVVVLMHNIILETKNNEIVDHKNHDTLNNKRNNIRKCSYSDNMKNTIKRKNTTSKYKGVSLFKRDNIWIAQIGYQNQNIYLGRFKNEIEAAKIYDNKAKELFGEFARLNFNY